MSLIIWKPVWESPDMYDQVLICYRIRPFSHDAEAHTSWVVGCGYLWEYGWTIEGENEQYDFQVCAWAEKPDPPQVLLQDTVTVLSDQDVRRAWAVDSANSPRGRLDAALDGENK